MEAWKGGLESKRLEINIKIKMMTTSDKAGKVPLEGKFPCAICRKGVREQVKCQSCKNQQTDIEDCPSMELNSQSL